MKRLLKAFLYSCLLAFITLFSVSFFWSSPLLLAGILIVVSVLMLLILRSKEDLLLYIICSISGALAESLAIVFGAWTYTLPIIIDIPYWLPFVWGIAALFIKRISLEIADFTKK